MTWCGSARAEGAAEQSKANARTTDNRDLANCAFMDSSCSHREASDPRIVGRAGAMPRCNPLAPRTRRFAAAKRGWMGRNSIHEEVYSSWHKVEWKFSFGVFAYDNSWIALSHDTNAAKLPATSSLC